MDVYSSMAFYVAKKLHMRPNDILDTWGVPELIVAYGEYSNEDAARNFAEWNALDPKSRKGERPDEVHVRFFSPSDIEEDDE